MRSTGNTFWLVKRDWKNFADYEEDMNKNIDKHRMISICTYSLDRCEACEVIDVLHNHESALFRRGREWKLVENSDSREKARSEEETRFRLITENARELILMVNLNGQCIYASPSFKTILGYGTKQFMSMRFTDLIHSEDLGQLPFWQNISLFEFRARKADGNWIWLEGSSNIVLYSGELAVNIVARDITERKTSEKAIKNLSRQNELVLNSASEGIFGLDLSGNHTFVNSAAAQMLGYRIRELIGKPSHKIWHHSKPDGSPYPETECPMYATCKDGIVRRVKNEEFWKKDGTSFPVAYTSTPILEGGKLIGAVVTFRDITERKREEEELKKHRKHLKELVEERTSELSAMNDELQQQILERKRIENELARSNTDLHQFAYAASHDLQEPLRVIEGYVNLLVRRYKDKLDEKANDLIGYTVDGVQRMQDIIKDLLEYSKVGSKGLHLKPVDCSFVVDKAMLNLQTAIDETGATVTYEKLPTVIADASQIGGLFQNLISNAIKFHGDAPLKIHISVDKKIGEWVFSVQDNGIGIDPQHLEKIFVVFQRLHTREEYPGTGIGLAICKRIVERHGGKIWVKSEPVKGSTFYFTIPDQQDIP